MFLCGDCSIARYKKESKNVNAKEIINNKEIEQVTPRILLKLSHTEIFSDGVEITVNYSFQDSTHQVIGIDKVYISGYTPAVYSSAEVIGYDIINEFNDNLYVRVRATRANTSNPITKGYYVSIQKIN